MALKILRKVGSIATNVRGQRRSATYGALIGVAASIGRQALSTEALECVAPMALFSLASCFDRFSGRLH